MEGDKGDQAVGANVVALDATGDLGLKSPGLKDQSAASSAYCDPTVCWSRGGSWDISSSRFLIGGPFVGGP